MLKKMAWLLAGVIILSSCAQKIVPADGSTSGNNYSQIGTTGATIPNNKVKTAATVEVKANEMENNVKASESAPIDLR